MNKALTLGVISVAITAGTYFVLHSIAPQRHVEEKRKQEGPSVDQVFAGQLNLASLDSDAAPAAEAPAAAVPAAAEAPVEAAAETAPEEAAPADATAEAAAPTGDVDASGGDMGAPGVAAVAAAPAEAPAPAEPAAAEPAPAAAPAPAAEPAPAPAPAQVAEAPKPAAKPVEKKKPAPAKPVGPWWGAESPNSLSVVYAGSAAYKKAVVLMLNGTFDNAESANKNIKVKDAAGKAVSGKWELGATNKKMLVFPVSKNGRYTVSVGSGLSDRNNRALGKKLSGAVQVQ